MEYDAGWVELASGRWAAARACFERAAAANETPEAQEGLSWAAWWLDDADVVFAAWKPAVAAAGGSPVLPGQSGSEARGYRLDGKRRQPRPSHG